VTQATVTITVNILEPGLYRVTFGATPTVERIGLARGLIDLKRVAEYARRSARIALRDGWTQADAFESTDVELTDGEDRIGLANPLTFARSLDQTFHPADVAEARKVARRTIRQEFRQHKARATKRRAR
jgi:hypothetical protein